MISRARSGRKSVSYTHLCGTGACAAVVASVLNGHCKKDADVDVLLLGGTLTIRYTGDTVLMTGNAVEVRCV